MKIHVRAPATSANLGAGFDVAAVALDLWNELEVTDNGSEPVDEEHLGVQACARFASPAGRRFSFLDRIPRERGLGSSAAVVALGLVAGALAAGVDPAADELLEAGVALEGHADNLAAALAGGVCLTWEGRIARVADDVPAAPIAVVPAARVRTAEARAALPETVPHRDAAYSAARAALLGAALASGRADLLAASADDRLHEPYRTPHAPRLAQLRGEPPPGALGVTLSGSGPTVLVWARKDEESDCVTALRARFPDDDVLSLPVTPAGAGAL